MPERPGSVEFVIKALEEFTDRVVRILILDAVANLVEDTPRLTGWARANWIPSILEPSSLDGTPPPEEGSASSVGARVGLREAGTAEVATRYRVGQGPAFITNNVPYIVRLNEGSSRQAPSGFVQLSLLRAIRQLERRRFTA